MTPTILTLPRLTLVGFSAHFISAMSPDANNVQVIPPLWDQLMARRGELPSPPDAPAYGACRGIQMLERARDDELEYLAAFAVDQDFPVPAGMSRWDVPPLTFARFTHRGPISRLKETIGFACGTWLATAPYQRDEGPELEIYDGRFRGEAPESELDYLIPIRSKH